MTHHIPKVITFSGIAAALLFVVCASFWYKYEYKTEIVTSKSSSVVLPPRVVTISKKTDTYSVTLEYPYISETLGAVANEYFKNYYSSSSDRFIHDVQESLANNDLPEELKKGAASYYTVSTHIVASTSEYSSFLVTGESYFVGSAHPSHSIDTFIFDKKNKKLVTVKDLFTDPSYVSVLAKASIAYFTSRNATLGVDDFKVDTSSSNEGFAPTSLNYSKILPTEKGLVIYFDEYQVAPYVAGPQEALIPYATLQSIINKDGVLGEYSK